MKTSKKALSSVHLTKPASIANYGTAGYRLKHPDLNNVLCRASLIAYVRSATFAGKYIGLYITASHNPVEYNGIKFIDFNGNMLEEAWEVYSDELVNSEDCDFNTIINRIFRHNSNNSMNDSIRGNVIIGRDTRESGIELLNNITSVLSQYKCNVYTYDEVTCPEMHYLVRKCNEKNVIVDKCEYINHLASNFKMLNPTLNFGVDTSNGVGEIKINELNKICDYKFEILNQGGILNKNVGADFIKTTKTVPIFEKLTRLPDITISGSFDGDVDRLILFSSDNRIFDGDAQSVYIAELLKREMDRCEISAEMGIVLSHYSNMAAVDYLRSRGFTTVMAQTGVKNFVKAAKKYDVGIYSEPNGHGSVIFSKRFLDKIQNEPEDSRLKILTRLFDPCVGDALANLLVFAGTLNTVDDLIKYKENYTRLMTVKVADKSIIKVDNENIVLSPDIQKRIDEVVLLFKGSRSFIRPSGTEDLVRIFAESPIDVHCDKLVLGVAQVVYDYCDGEGPHPEILYK